MSKQQATVRLQKEYRSISKDFEKQMAQGKIVENFVTCPDSNNIFEWYFIIFGLEDEPWKGGFYLGKIMFPNEYPFKPPTIMLITDSGRFRTNMGICLAISNHHPESWNPSYSVRNIIMGLLTFFISNDDTYGSIPTREISKER